MNSTPNPDELQPVGMSDKDVERMVQNYVTQKNLAEIDTDTIAWSPLNANSGDLPEMQEDKPNSDSQ